MAEKDLYEVLGVARNADAATIKKAYRRLAMKYHPDRNPGDQQAEERFKDAQRAYDVLCDDEKRAAYDRFGEAGLGGGGGPAHGGFGDIFGDVFGDIFGGRRGAARGADLRYDLELDLAEAAAGTTVKIRIPTRKTCGSCNGSGAAAGSQPTRCPTCEGHGQVRMQQGFFSVQQTCPSCHGQGQVISDPCRACGGAGQVRDTKTLSVKVPAGVDTGDRIRLSGEGEAGGPGVAPGDLYVEMHIRPHPLFERDGNDLYTEVPASITTAALGGEVTVPSLEGRLQITVPAGTQTGKLLRVRGKGMPSVRGQGVGDLLCRIVVETPVNLTGKQKAMLKEFGASLGEQHSPRESSWFDKVKTFFDGKQRSENVG